MATQSNRQLPFVSVIMPIRNEAAYIERSLSAVLAQDYPADRMEILVVDGMSDDGTRELVRQIGAKVPPPSTSHQLSATSYRPPPIRFLDNPSRIVPTALNIGLRHARGDIIIRVDGHCEIPHDYVGRCVEGLQNYSAECFGGQLETVGETWTARATALAQSSPFGVGNARFRTGSKDPMQVDTVAFGAYRREVFERIGSFDENFLRNQDYEFNHRLIKAGGRIFLTPELRTVYYVRSTLSKLWRQYFQYGYWKVQTLKKHPDSLKVRQLVPPLFILSIIAGIIAGLWKGQMVLLGSILTVYLISALTAATFAVSKRNHLHTSVVGCIRLAITVVVVFAVLHLSWGMGFLWGVLTFPLPPRKVPWSGY